MADLERSIDRIAGESGFCGVVRVDRGGVVELAKAYGLAHRGLGVANESDTIFGTASAAKGPTALVVVDLVARGELDLDTPVRSLLGEDLPLIADDVTIGHLLSHTSGIGDYLDEDQDLDFTDHVLPVPVHQLASAQDYLAVLDGFPTKFPAGASFSYCNGGYVVLAIVAERAAGRSYYDLIDEVVIARAGLRDTAFLRSDELPGRVATGYLTTEGLRSNVLHLPVRGCGDGGLFTTAADVHAFWTALFEGRIVPSEYVAEMVRPRNDAPTESMRYGMGFWVHATTEAVILVGMDAGVSFRSVHEPSMQLTATVLSNTTMGAWPVAKELETELGVR